MAQKSIYPLIFQGLFYYLATKSVHSPLTFYHKYNHKWLGLKHLAFTFVILALMFFSNTSAIFAEKLVLVYALPEKNEISFYFSEDVNASGNANGALNLQNYSLSGDGAENVLIEGISGVGQGPYSLTLNQGLGDGDVALNIQNIESLDGAKVIEPVENAGLKSLVDWSKIKGKAKRFMPATSTVDPTIFSPLLHSEISISSELRVKPKILKNLNSEDYRHFLVIRQFAINSKKEVVFERVTQNLIPASSEGELENYIQTAATTWDARGQDGEVVPNGTYRIFLHASVYSKRVSDQKLTKLGTNISRVSNVKVDGAPPELTWVNPSNYSLITKAAPKFAFRYNKYLRRPVEDPHSHKNPANYVLSGSAANGVNVTEVVGKGRRVHYLVLDGELTDGEVTLTISNIKDLAGHTMPVTTFNYTVRGIDDETSVYAEPIRVLAKSLGVPKAVGSRNLRFGVRGIDKEPFVPGVFELNFNYKLRVRSVLVPDLGGSVDYHVEQHFLVLDLEGNLVDIASKETDLLGPLTYNKVNFASVDMSVAWDGKDENNDPVAEGEYMYMAYNQLFVTDNGVKTLKATTNPVRGVVKIASDPVSVLSATPSNGAETMSTTESISVTFDKDMFLDAGAEFSVLNPASFSLTGEGVTGLSIESVDGSGSGPYTLLLSGNLLPGLVQVQLSQVATKLGGVLENSHQWEFLVDNQAPSLSMTSPAVDAYTSQNVLIQGVAQDALSDIASVQIEINDVDLGNATLQGSDYSMTLNDLAEGLYDVVVTATDGVGNQTEVTQSFTVDATAPVLNITNPDVNELVFTTNTPTFRGVYSDTIGVNESSLQVIISGVDVSSAVIVDAGNFEVTPNVADGTHLLQVSITDYAGNTTTADRVLHIDLSTTPNPPGTGNVLNNAYTQKTIIEGVNPQYLRVLDVNKDGKNDIVYKEINDGKIKVIYQN